MKTPIRSLIALLTANGLDSVSLVNYPEVAEWFKQEDPNAEEVVVQYYTPTHPILWSTPGWIAEQKRLAGIDNTITAHREAHPWPTPKLTLEEKLDAALEAGDLERIRKLKELMAFMKGS